MNLKTHLKGRIRNPTNTRIAESIGARIKNTDPVVTGSIYP
jgi:hypothetical protein